MRGARASRRRRTALTIPRARDGKIDAEELDTVFKKLGHKCKRVRACTLRLRAACAPRLPRASTRRVTTWPGASFLTRRLTLKT